MKHVVLAVSRPGQTPRALSRPSRDLVTVAALLLMVAMGPAHARAQQPQDVRALLVEDFAGGIDAWRVQRLDRRSTLYQVVDMDGNSVLKGSSNAAAAALVRSVERGLISQGRLRWRWRVMASLSDNSHETEKRGDDYAARVLVLFGEAELGDRTRALAYVWAGQEAIGSRFPNPYASEEVATIVLESGDGRAGQWVVEERDILADYALSFGGAPPELAAIALLVDTDDTGGAAMAWFDDIQLLVSPTMIADTTSVRESCGPDS